MHASPAQRLKVRDKPCVVCGCMPCDPAHICARAQGGCDDPLCCIPLDRICHNALDTRRLDLLPHHKEIVPELQHALGHYQGNLLGLLSRVTGERWRPVQPVETLSDVW